MVNYLDCRPGCHFGIYPFQNSLDFLWEKLELIHITYISNLTRTLKEEDRSEGIIKEVMFSPEFKICFVRIYSLALRPNALLILTSAGGTGTAGPLSKSTSKFSYYQVFAFSIFYF